jgi:(S)-mandelate dehydrogenase
MRHPRRRRYAGSNLERCLTIADLERKAARRLPNFVFEYIQGGSEEEVALRHNRQVFDRWRFLTRSLCDVSNCSLETQILGRPSSLPLVIAPTGFAGLMWPDGDVALAAAAGEVGIPFTQSTVSNSPIASVASSGIERHWFQLYAYDTPKLDILLQRALDAGCEALVVTTDSPVVSNREWDRRNYVSGIKLDLRSRLDALCHPRWLVDHMVRRSIPLFENLVDLIEGDTSELMAMRRWLGQHMPTARTWDWLRQLRAQWPRKLIVKGILCLEDVGRAIGAGADGIVLSNHGGRQMDRTASPMELLADARCLAGKDFTILIDSGFRRGSEVVQALALGANAVMLGRATLYGLAAAGQPGVVRALRIFEDELKRNLPLLGATRIADLSPAMLLDSRPGYPVAPGRSYSVAGSGASAIAAADR